jgi:hypothetical protein
MMPAFNNLMALRNFAPNNFAPNNFGGVRPNNPGAISGGFSPMPQRFPMPTSPMPGGPAPYMPPVNPVGPIGVGGGQPAMPGNPGSSMPPVNPVGPIGVGQFGMGGNPNMMQNPGLNNLLALYGMRPGAY